MKKKKYRKALGFWIFTILVFHPAYFNKPFVRVAEWNIKQRQGLRIEEEQRETRFVLVRFVSCCFPMNLTFERSNVSILSRFYPILGEKVSLCGLYMDSDGW